MEIMVYLPGLGTWKTLDEGIARNVLLLGVQLESDLRRDKWRAHESNTHQSQSLVGKVWNWNQMSEKQSPRLHRNCQVGHGFGRNICLVSAKWFGESRSAAWRLSTGIRDDLCSQASQATQAVRALT